MTSEAGSPDPLPPGSHVRGYQVLRCVRRGGMALLYEAFSAKQGRRAAIKVLRPGVNSDIAARFEREARATNRVHHHHPGARGAVTLYETGHLEDHTPYIIMEYLDGDLLQERLKQAAGCADAHHLRLLAQLACTLAAVHSAGVVHRDVKPDNIVLVKDEALPGGERAVLIDFGIARLPREERAQDGTETQAHSFLGSSHYAAPEQRLSPQSVDGQADVYALGVVLHQLCTGRRPFEGPENEVVMLHLTRLPTPPAIRGLPKELVGLVVAMLAKEPGARPTMAEVAARLRRCAAQAGGRRASGTRRGMLIAGALLGVCLPAGLVLTRAESPRPRDAALEPDLPSPAEPAPADLGLPTSLDAVPDLGSPRLAPQKTLSPRRSERPWTEKPRIRNPFESLRYYGERADHE